MRKENKKVGVRKGKGLIEEKENKGGRVVPVGTSESIEARERRGPSNGRFFLFKTPKYLGP